MKHAAAIELLETSAATCEHNAQIQRACGEKQQAEYNETRARELRDAQKALQS